MDGATKLDKKENHVMSSKEKGPVTSSLRTPLSDVQSNTRSNIPGKFTNNLLKPDSLLFSFHTHFVSFLNESSIDVWLNYNKRIRILWLWFIIGVKRDLHIVKTVYTIYS
ncbi:hypothetical protein S245_047628 [Arachis hypogaea]